jgi:hypothetical protein
MAQQKILLKSDLGALSERDPNQAPFISSPLIVVPLRYFISQLQALFSDLTTPSHHHRFEIQNSQWLEGHICYG